MRKREPRFPRPCGTPHTRPVPPAQQRPAPAMGGAGAGRGRWPPAGPDASVMLWQGRWPLPWKRGVLSSVRAGPGNATRVSPAQAQRSPVDRQVRETQRPAPDPAGEKRPPVAGRALAGGFGPRLGKDQCGAVAGAMAPAIWALAVPSLPRAGPGNAIRVSPARAGRCPADRQARERQRPAPGPAGAKRPPVAGRALAGGCGPPAGHGSARCCGRGDGPRRDAQDACWQ